MELISSLPIETFGATGILAIVALLVFRGNLIPRSVHEDRMKDKDAQIEYYRSGYEKEVRRGDELTAMCGALMEVGSTTQHVLTSLQQATQKGELEHETASSS